MDDEHLQLLLIFRNKCTSLIVKLENLKMDSLQADDDVRTQVEVVLNAVREIALGDYFDSVVKHIKKLAQDPTTSSENITKSGTKLNQWATLSTDNKSLDSSATSSEKVAESGCEPSE